MFVVDGKSVFEMILMWMMLFVLNIFINDIVSEIENGRSEYSLFVDYVFFSGGLGNVGK